MRKLSDIELGKALFKALRNEPKFDVFREYIEELRRTDPMRHETSSGFSFQIDKRKEVKE